MDELPAIMHSMLQEMFFRNVVFLTSFPFGGAEIIARVAARENPPFRPVVGTRDCPEELTDLMERCWLDNPEERPTFEMIRSIIRNIRK
jgi:atrial natriuretic peptide receptor A